MHHDGAIGGQESRTGAERGLMDQRCPGLGPGKRREGEQQAEPEGQGTFGESGNAAAEISAEKGHRWYLSARPTDGPEPTGCGPSAGRVEELPANASLDVSKPPGTFQQRRKASAAPASKRPS